MDLSKVHPDCRHGWEKGLTDYPIGEHIRDCNKCQEFNKTPDQETKCRVVAEKILGWTLDSVDSNRSWITPHGGELGYHSGLKYLLTGNGMVKLMEALNKLNCAVRLYCYEWARAEIDPNYSEQLVDPEANPVLTGRGDTPAEALLNAAYELVKDDD